MGGTVNARNLLPPIRELYSRRPETRLLAPWERQTLLWSLGYVDDFADEGESAAPTS